jgi:hypothetical protein
MRQPITVRPVRRIIRVEGARVIRVAAGVVVNEDGAVLSVFGRQGAVVAATGDYTAGQITETATRVFVSPAQKTAIGTALQPEDVGTAASANVEDFATAEQGGKADSALQSLPAHGNEAHSPDFLSAETDPVFGASEAALLEPGDKSKIDNALQSLPAHAGSHTNGTDDIQDATASQKGLMTSTQAGQLASIMGPTWQDRSADVSGGVLDLLVAWGQHIKLDIGAGAALEFTAANVASNSAMHWIINLVGDSGGTGGIGITAPLLDPAIGGPVPSGSDLIASISPAGVLKIRLASAVEAAP